MSPSLCCTINGSILDKVLFCLFLVNLKEQTLLAQVFIILYLNVRRLNGDEVFLALTSCRDSGEADKKIRSINKHVVHVAAFFWI